MISDKVKGLIALSYLIVGIVFLSIGDAYNVNWYALFFENEHILGLLALLFVRNTIKSTAWGMVLEVAILWKLFYIVFNLAILFKPFYNYRDFTSNPVICVQILWCIIGFSIIQRFRI